MVLLTKSYYRRGENDIAATAERQQFVPRLATDACDGVAIYYSLIKPSAL